MSRYRSEGNLFPLTFFAFSLLLIAYFSYHGFHGKYGVYARDGIQAKIAQLNLDLSHLSRQREILDRNVALMHPEQIDPDMLDEQARRVLNLARPDEIIMVDTSW